MPNVDIRKVVHVVEEIFHEGGPRAKVPLRRAAALAVIRNPFAGRYVEQIEEFMNDLKPLGLEMAKLLVTELGGDPKVVEGYGKGAIVGSAGQPRDGNNAACYALFDSERERLTFYRVPYDHGAAIRKIRAAGLPERLAMRLERGT